MDIAMLIATGLLVLGWLTFVVVFSLRQRADLRAIAKRIQSSLEREGQSYEDLSGSLKELREALKNLDAADIQDVGWSPDLSPLLAAQVGSWLQGPAQELVDGWDQLGEYFRSVTAGVQGHTFEILESGLSSALSDLVLHVPSTSRLPSDQPGLLILGEMKGMPRTSELLLAHTRWRWARMYEDFFATSHSEGHFRWHDWPADHPRKEYVLYPSMSRAFRSKTSIMAGKHRVRKAAPTAA